MFVTKRIVTTLLMEADGLKLRENELITKLSEMKRRERFLGICLVFIGRHKKVSILI